MGRSMNNLQKISSTFVLVGGLLLSGGCGGLQPEYKRGHKVTDSKAQSVSIIVESLKLHGCDEYLVREENYDFKSNQKETITYRVDTAGGQNVEYGHSTVVLPIAKDDPVANQLRNEMMFNQSRLNMIP